jgi:hemerythrin
MSIEWHDDSDKGDLLVYTHHYELISRFNALLQKYNSNMEIDAIGNYLKYLKNYVSYYFEAEERGMIASKYPLFNGHKAEHDLFKDQVNQHYEEYLLHGVNTRVFVMTIRSSGEWLVNHIYKTDQTMVAYLKDRVATNSSFFN